MKDRPRQAVFLDRDGVINALVYRPKEGIWDSPYSVDELRLLPGVAEAVRRINAMGLLAIVVSNQPGVAKGKCDQATLDQITSHMRRELVQQGAKLDGIYYCLHHPQAVVPDLRRECRCRKPRPGLILQAAREHSIDLFGSYMIGDTLNDVQAGQGAGCETILICQHPQESGQLADLSMPHWTAKSLLEAVTDIVAKGR